jgi:adenylate cyclase
MLRQSSPVKDFQFEREAGRRVSHVFISYARSTEEQAIKVEKALRDAGYGVWRDAELPAHRSYADVIEERLKAANAVVVLWSTEAARSQWKRMPLVNWGR